MFTSKKPKAKDFTLAQALQARAQALHDQDFYDTERTNKARLYEESLAKLKDNPSNMALAELVAMLDIGKSEAWRRYNEAALLYSRMDDIVVKLGGTRETRRYYC